MPFVVIKITLSFLLFGIVNWPTIISLFTIFDSFGSNKNIAPLSITNEVYAATILGIALTTGLRLVAMKYNWNLPKVKSR